MRPRKKCRTHVSRHAAKSPKSPSTGWPYVDSASVCSFVSGQLDFHAELCRASCQPSLTTWS